MSKRFLEINMKLDNKKLLLLKQQINLMVSNHGLENNLDGFTIAPPKFNLYKQGCALTSWLLSIVNPHILHSLASFETFSSMLETLFIIFFTHSITKVMHLHYKFKGI
ncbi:hypothetical protein CXB51_035139 [Gossypium anomalum]|uniref:Uncharacterized protein n=1 Tax=Gossypium anomalum TaxID=47600 RepID=A0A8J5Y9C0_9ROSI|nr:hypothetical protein CXB51_035139 [Gossypium anomalum]